MKRGCETVLYSPRKRGCKVAEAALPMIRPCDVPLYLRESEFYKSLNLEDNEEFHVPANLMKANMTVESLQDVMHLLHTARFWGANVSLTPILDFCFKAPFVKVESALRGFEHDIPLVKCALQVLENRESPEQMIKAAVECGSIEMVQYLERKFGVKAHSGKVVAAAAKSGNTAILEYVLHSFQSTNFVDVTGIYEGAVANGHIQCIILLNQHPELSLPKLISDQPRAAQQLSLASTAAAYGHFECLQYLHSMGCPLHRCVLPAAASGCVDCLKYVFDHRESYIGPGTKAKACLAAASNDKVDALKYLHEQQECTLSQSLYIKAAAWGSIKCMRYYFSVDRRRSFWICHSAALNGHSNCLKFAHENDCPLGGNLIYNHPDYRTTFNVSDGPSRVVELVAKRQHWDCVYYLIVQGHRLTSGLTTHFARHNQYQMLQMAVERGCEMDAAVADFFASNGNLQGLKYALEHGCSPSAKILCAAAENGQLECMKYAHEQGCPWSKEVRIAAARGGQMDCLQYAREHGCPCDEGVVVMVESKGYDGCKMEEQLYW